MIRVRPIVLPLLLVLSLTDCNCSDTLGSAVGQINLALCDRGDACGCGELPAEDSHVDFGTPADGTTTRRILRIENLNRPMPVTVTGISLDDTSGIFQLVSLKRYESYDNDSTVEALDVTGRGYILQGEQYLELAIDFSPTQPGEISAGLTVTSSSRSHASWSVNLRGGAGSSETCISSGDCGDGTLLDFGVFDESEVGADLADPLGRPLALGLEPISITNTGAGEMLVNVELVDDGIPETTADEPTGRAGYFFLGEVGCAVVGPGETLEVPVEYRPSTAGEHRGQVVVAGLGAPIYIDLLGKVIGPHICFETEDDLPTDSTLTFGQAPTYTTGQNSEETRRIFASNCGYDADLIIDAIDLEPNSTSDYSSTELPWTGPITLAVGERIEVPITFAPTPQSAIGSMPNGAVDFTSNDNRYPLAQVDLNGVIGQPERCILVPSESPVDFGWVAADEAGVGEDCDSLPISIPGCEELISRAKAVTFTNVGQRDCINITPEALIADATSEDMFQYYNPDAIPEPFSLAPGESSSPINLLFKRPPTENPQNHFAKMPYTSDNGDSEELILEARGGGSPNCAIDFSPVANPTFFCPDESVAFGNVNIGQAKTIDVQVINTGSQECAVGAINFGSLTSSAFSYQSATLPGTIPVNESRTISLTFEPTPPSGNNPFEEIPFLCGQNSLSLTVNSGPNGTLTQETVSLSGNGTRPDIDVIPGELDFGLVTVGCCSEWKDVRVYNSGDGDLTINGLSIVAGSSPGFESTQPTNNVIVPDSSTEFRARFCASEVGEASGVIEIQSTDDNEEYFTVPMRAEGTLDNTGIDAFQQPERPMVDVLWAIDDSGSMSEEQQSLANNFENFIDTASSLDTDYHMGVVNTDSESEWAGKLYACSGNPLWIDDTQNVATQRSQFQCNVQVSDSGRPSSDSKESPLQSARMALDYPNIDDHNAGFYREEAKLYVILVTDEEDQSDGTPQLYVDYFRNLKGVGNPDLLNISAIAGPPPGGCDTADGNQMDYDAVDAVGGQFRSICSADWANLISGLGLDVFNARRQFPLSRPATQESITVTICDDDGNGNPINCQEVPYDSVNGWSFDPVTNSIVLNGSGIPGPGQHIEVNYEAACFE